MIFCSCTLNGKFRDLLSSEVLEELFEAIINDGLVAFRISNLLDFSRHDVYLQLCCLRQILDLVDLFRNDLCTCVVSEFLFDFLDLR